MGEQSLQQGYLECADLTRSHARNFFLAFRLLRRRKRHGLYALYAFARHADDIVDDPLDQLAARGVRVEGRLANAPETDQRRALLDEYRERFADALDGRPSAPWWAALADTLDQFAIPRDLPGRLLDGCAQDLTTSRYDTWDDTLGYCWLVASVPGLMAMHVFGRADAAAVPPGVALGFGMQLTNILRDVSEDAGRDRIYLPRELWEPLGLTDADWLERRPTDAMAAALRVTVDRADDCFAVGRQLAPLLPADSAPCPAVLAAMYGAILARIRRDPLRVLTSRVRLRTRAKLTLALKAYARARLRVSPRHQLGAGARSVGGDTASTSVDSDTWSALLARWGRRWPEDATRQR